MTQKTLINLQEICFAYNQELILDHVSLRVEKGDFIGMIGPNGGGKTTLLKIILGLLKADSGHAEIQSKKIAYVAQHAGYKQHFLPISVEEVLQMTGAKESAIIQALAITNLSEKRERLLRDLSVGQQQRVFIARALLTQAEILILDEPTVGVDQQAQNQFYDLLRDLNQNHKLSIILVSHEIDLIAKEVKQIVCINKKLIYHGQAAALQDKKLLQKVFGTHQQLIPHHQH